MKTNKTERRFKFQLVKMDFWDFHRLYGAMRVVQGEITPKSDIEIVNENRERWDINSRDEFKMSGFLNHPHTDYIAIVNGTEQDFDYYQAVFRKYTSLIEEMGGNDELP